MAKVDLTNYDFSEREGRSKFINEMESSVYDGTNINGEEVWVFLDKGEGMIVKTRHHEKPRWLECVNYDSEGYQCGVTYEPYV